MSEFSELLRRAREGDRTAAADLYARYRDEVERAGRRGLGSHLHSRFDTEDIAQSVFADMLRELPALEDRGEVAFRGWLATKVRHKLATKGRRQSHSNGRRREERLLTEMGLEQADSGPDPAAAVALQDDAARLTSLLGTLDATQSAVIGLFLDEGLSWDEVAARLDLPSGAAARMRYVRALAALRERWSRG